MKLIGKYILIIILITGYFNAFSQSMTKESTLTEIKPQNKIIIQGSTNISNFTLSLSFNKDDVKSIDSRPACSAEGYKVLNLPVTEFCYSHPQMKKDFYQLIDAKEYPNIKIYYPAKMLDKETCGNSRQYELIVEIKNICQKYTVPVKYYKLSGSCIEALGNLNVRLSDFHLQPKKYFFGLIKVKNNLTINFYLYF